MALKKYRFKAIILILLFVFGLMSGYSLWNYHGSTGSQSQITQQIRGKGVNRPGAQNSANTPGISSGTDERGQAIAGGSPQGKMRNFNNGGSTGNQLTFVYLKDKRLLLLTAGFSLTVYANTHYVLFETLKGMNTVPYNSVLFLTSLLNVLLLGWLIKVIYNIAVKGRTIQ